ncbi:MAG: CBS domain-containing protein [Pirellulaceae bacterium]|nr:CBS domain-containing protein [Pirellulaceae bacterium]
MEALQLATLITYNPWTVRSDTLLGEIDERFAAMGIHHVPVVDDDRRPVGMISETDLLRARQARRMLATVGGGGEPTGWAGQTAASVMQRAVQVADPTDSPRQALQVLLSFGIHALPVVENGRLVGVVTSRDFLRECSYGELPVSRRPISEFVQPAKETLEPETTLEQALLTMHERGASCLAVAQDGCPLGTLSQRDIVRAHCLAGEETEDEYGFATSPPNVMRAARAGNPLRPGQRLHEAAAAMLADGLSAVLVANQANRLLGVLTEDDLLRIMQTAV